MHKTRFHQDCFGDSGERSRRLSVDDPQPDSSQLDDWEVEDHSRGTSEELSLLDLAYPDEPYNQERAERQKKALDNTAEADLRSYESISDLMDDN